MSLRSEISNSLDKFFGGSDAPLSALTASELAAREKYANEQRIRKDAIRHHLGLRLFRIVRNTLTCAFAAVATTSAVSNFYPDLAAKPFNDHMTDKGYAPDQDKYFHNKQIRVYRNLPMASLHIAGANSGLRLKNALTSDGLLHKTFALASEPLIYAADLYVSYNGLKLQDSTGIYNAFMLNMGQLMQNDKGSYVIEVGPDFSLRQYLNSTLGLPESQQLTFRNDPEKLEKLLYQLIMLHEARHADQTLPATSLNETDADHYAFKVMQQQGTDPALLNEALEIWHTLRTVRALAGDTFHCTTDLGVGTPPRSIQQGIEDPAGFAQLQSTLVYVGSMNDNKFPYGMSNFNRVFFTLQRILVDEECRSNRPLHRAAQATQSAMLHMDRLCGGTLLTGEFAFMEIDMTCLKLPYDRIPDPLPAAAVIPSSAKPQSWSSPQ